MASTIIYVLLLLPIVLNFQLIHSFKIPNLSDENDIEDIFDDDFDDAYEVNGNQPIFVQILWRHGDRNIVEPYPTDPYKNESLWPGGFGTLTNIGKRQHFELGKFIRQRYRKLLSKKYLAKEFYIQSTDSDRTLMSAQCNLYGLFPPMGTEVWKVGVPWQPIPIHTTPLKDDYILNPSVPCEKRDVLVETYAAQIIEEHRAFADYLQMNSGIDNMTFQSVLKLNDAISVEDLKGFKLPQWAEKSKETLYYLSTLLFEAYSHSIELKKMVTGHLIKDILDRFKSKSLSTLGKDRKMWVYSAHDMNIANILNALNVFDPHLPSYAASLYFEMYKRGSQYYIELYHRNLNEQKPPQLEIPNCGKSCPLDRFYELFSDILPNATETHEYLCQL